MKMKNMLVPVVVENVGGGERAYDIYSRLLKDRIVFVSGEVEDGTARPPFPGARRSAAPDLSDRFFY